MKKIVLTLSVLLMFTLAACGNEQSVSTESVNAGMSELSATALEETLCTVTLPAYEIDNAEKSPYIDAINSTPKFQVRFNLPDGWAVKETKPDGKITLPGNFYTPLTICREDTPIGYIGFNAFEPYGGQVEDGQYYKTVYSDLRMSSLFHWDPYTAIKTTDTAETGIADIWYLDLEEIDQHPGAMPDVPQLETIGLLSYDKEQKVYISIAFLPDTVERTQVEAIAQSVQLSPVA